MAKSFRDIAQDLRSKPALRLPNGQFVDRMWIVQDTVPASAYPACITSTAKNVTKAIAVAAPGTVVTDGDLAFGIAGSWGATFTVRVGGTKQDTTARLCIPSGSTQSQLLSRLYERMAREHSVVPAFTSGGALAIFDTAGAEAVATTPGGVFSLASGTANFATANAPAKYRTGALHPECGFLRLFQVESSGRDDHNVNLTLFYRVDLDLLATTLGTTGDVLRARTGYEISEPHDNSAFPQVVWTFEILNPERYNRPANGTAHPWVAGCILTNETRTEQQGSSMVTRKYEPIPGPTIATKTGEKDGFDLTTYTKRVFAASPGSAPTPPSGQDVIDQSLETDTSTYVATWVVQAQSRVTRTESTAVSAAVEGISTRTQKLAPSAEAADAFTTSLQTEPQTRDKDGNPVLWSTSKGTFSLPPPGPLSTNLNFKPGVTLRSTAKIVATPVEKTNVADYQNSVTERNTAGTPIAYREQVTTSQFTGTTINPAGIEQRPMVTLTTNKKWSLNPTISTPTGNSGISHYDPSLTVYEVEEVTATGKERTIGVSKDAGPGYRLENTESYSLNSSLATPQGNVDIAYDDGVVTVFKKGEVRLFAVPLTFESGRQKSPLIERRTITRYSTSPAIGTDNGSSRVAKTDGTTHIYAVEEETFIPGEVREYGVILQASTPPVLIGLNISPIPKRDGSSDYRVVPRIQEGYRGSFQGKVREYWSATPPNTSAFKPVTFTPQPIHFNGARLNISLGETLHGAITIFELIGNNDPVYESQFYSHTYPATTPSAIPTGWQPYGMEVDPMENGGYRVREFYILYKV